MKLWVFNHYASTPDQPTTGAYFLLKGLTDLGVDVTVYASGFSYYKRRELRLGTSLFTRRDNINGLTFEWVRTIPTSGRIFSRLLNMSSYAVVAFIKALFSSEKPDFVIGVCPHPLAGLAAWAIAKLKGAQFIYEVRDIWPESMTEGGILNPNGLPARALKALQMFLYRESTLVISVLPGVGTYLAENGLKDKPFLWLPNGILLDHLGSQPTRPSPSDTFKVYYIGGHSKYHALDDLLNAALLIQKNRGHHIHITLIGDGSEKPRLMARAISEGIHIVTFHDAVPRTDIHTLVQEADAIVITSRSMPIHRYGISPNKLCDALLAGRPVIMALPAVNDIVSHIGAGIMVPPHDVQALADAMIQMRDMPAPERAAMGARGYDYARTHFDAKRLAQQLKDTLEQHL